MASRNRILYQSEALYVGDNSTATGPAAADVASQLNRVQDISHDLDITRTDIFEFGRLAPLTRQIIEAPTVSLDFSYLLADGDNEDNMGLEIAKAADAATWDAGNFQNAISGILDDDSKKEKNYYVVTTKEHHDADAAGGTAPTATDCTVVGFGNGVISNYVINAAVGDLPTASVSIEAYNCRFADGVAGTAGNWISGISPRVNKETSQLKNDYFQLPAASSGTLEVFSLRPGDVTVSFSDGGSEANKLQIGGAILPTGDGDPDSASTADGDTPVHIQNFSIEMPLARTPLNRIGSAFPYDRAVDFPLDMTFNMSSFLADVSEGQLIDLMCNDQETRDITVDCKFPCGDNRAGETTDMKFVIKNAYLQSQNFGATIGDNKTVDLSFTAQLGGVNDTGNGLFISGQA